jgi:hypothetical protein
MIRRVRSSLAFLALVPGLALAGEATRLEAQSAAVRLEVSPANPVLVPGDSVQLTARAVDANGREVPGIQVRFTAAGGRFEAVVRPDGVVLAGATSTVPVSVIGVRPDGPPIIEVVEVRVVPAPPARLELAGGRDRLAVGQSQRMTATSFSRDGDRRPDSVQWESSNPAVLRVSDRGVLTAVSAGRAEVVARVTGGEGGSRVEARHTVEVVGTPVARVEITPGAERARQGDVIRFEARALDASGRVIEGLEPTWSFSPGQGLIQDDGRFVGYDPGSYTIMASFGTAAGTAAVDLDPRDVRRPVEVVGRLPRTLFTTEEVWIHPNGVNAYLGTGSGGDRFYALDISDPSNPIVTDSVVANTRRVNDLMTTPDGRYMVFTREGAADRRNGLVVAHLYDPAHPVPIAEFTDGVTAGVHSSFIYAQEPYGTHVYLTNNGTGAIHIVDLNDPYNPREVAQWRTPRPDAGRTLHDVDVQDGLAYLSYWNDGLVILDIGNGIRGGSPSNPQFVSQFKIDLNEEYRDVEARHGPGFIRGTHTAWRHGNYVFIADEVFPADDVLGASDAAASRAFGNLHVLDVTDIENPKRVAWWKPDYGGVHNLWVAGDTLYMGAYNAGFRAFDISGELLGDLRAQEREMVHVHTGDMNGYVPNDPMTWGVVVRDGLAYVNDMHNGLWVIRILPKSQRPIFP